MLWFIAMLGGLLLMMGQRSRSEALFYYFRLEDQVSGKSSSAPDRSPAHHDCGDNNPYHEHSSRFEVITRKAVFERQSGRACNPSFRWSSWVVRSE
jgi:hypothetical protein